MDKTFWIHQPSVLLSDVSNYIPNDDMNMIEKLNSITLFCIIIMIIMIAFRFVRLAILPLLIIIFIIIFYENKYEDFEVGDKFKSFNKEDEYDNIIRINNNRYKKENDNDKIKELVDLDDSVKMGFYDSDDILRFNRTTNKLNQHDDNNLVFECKKPTINNPFMNIQLHDFDNQQQIEACNEEDDKINKDINHSFNTKLFMNIDDTFSRTNSQRQFFTTPNTRIPNNQTEFANWLYKMPETCKENNEKCLKYDDIRYNMINY